MPTYDYVCEACGHALEIFQSISESPKRKCPACGALKLRRQIGTGAGLIFKGSGFYLTDYRSDSYKKAAEAERKGSEPASDGKSDGKKEKKEGGAKEPKKDSGKKPAGGGGTSGGD